MTQSPISWSPRHSLLILFCSLLGMSVLPFLALVLTFYAPLSSSDILTDNSDGQKFFIYRERIKVINQLLAKECPELLDRKSSTPSAATAPFDLKSEKAKYKGLFDKLMSCRTKPCYSATTLTGYWRLSHNASRIRPGGPNNSGKQACDLRSSLQWFRFSGAAGMCVREFL